MSPGSCAFLVAGDERCCWTTNILLDVDVSPSDSSSKSFRAAQNLRKARYWIVLLSIPCIQKSSFTSYPFLTPDLLRQGRLAVVLCSPLSLWTRESQDSTCPGVWRRRSRDVLQTSNLAEQCCYCNRNPRSLPVLQGVMMPYKHHLARSHILFLRFLHSLLDVCVLDHSLVTVLRSLPGSKHFAVPLTILLIGIRHSFGEAWSWSAPWLLTGNRTASSLKTSPWRLWELTPIELYRIPPGTSSHTPII